MAAGLATVGEEQSTSSKPSTTQTQNQQEWSAVDYYTNLLHSNDNMSIPIAAIETLAQVISRSSSSTTTELLAQLHSASQQLADASFNPISTSCGSSLLLRFLTVQRPPPEMSFQEFKKELVKTVRDFVKGSGRCRRVIAENMADFVRDESVLMVHGYSRVVVQALLYAAQSQKKRFQVYVTESRPYGLGLKTHAILSEAGIDCVVILDSAVSYIMAKADYAVCGAEAVCESGGLVNFIGGYQLALAAKAHGKPMYALAESFKFCRTFPLSQYDLPSSLPLPPLSFPQTPSTPSTSTTIPPTPSRPMLDSPVPTPLSMTDEMTRSNPTLDYTPGELVNLIISDLGVMTPAGISDALLNVYGGE
ncbi:nagb/rpia/CoA transferase-like protein [Meredithblackwellia eburnea MCA 4105]